MARQESVAAAGKFLGCFEQVKDGSRRFEAEVNDWSNRSKAPLRRRGDPGFAPARLEPAHRQATNAWLAGQGQSQSTVLATIGPQRLMTFIS